MNTSRRLLNLDKIITESSKLEKKVYEKTLSDILMEIFNANMTGGKPIGRQNKKQKNDTLSSDSLYICD